MRARLRLSTAEVEVCGRECGSAPINVVTFARARRNERKKRGSPPDRVFCVVDVDHHTRQAAYTDVDLILLAMREASQPSSAETVA